MKPRVIGAIVSLLVLLTVAWGWTEEAKKEPEKIPDVIAKVNGKDILGKDYQRLYDILVSSARVGGGEVSASQKQSIKETAIDRLVTMELLTQKAQELKIPVDESKVNEEIETIKKRKGSDEEFRKELEKEGLTEEALRDRIRRSLAIMGLVDREVASKIQVTAEEAKAYYESNKDKFEVPERVKAQHILIRFSEKGGAQEKQQALAKIKEAEQRVSKGEDFGEVAKSVSQDGSASQGGELGYFGRGQMVPEFENAAFSLEIGKVSPIVETAFGYHLIKVEDHQKARTLEFPEVEAKLVQYLKQQKTGNEFDSYIKGLTVAAKVEKVPF